MRARLSTGEDDIRREKQRLDHIEAVVAAKSGHEEMENKLSTKANIEEVNASIVSVIEELDKKASLQVRCMLHSGAGAGCSRCIARSVVIVLLLCSTWLTK